MAAVQYIVAALLIASASAYTVQLHEEINNAVEAQPQEAAGNIKCHSGSIGNVGGQKYNAAPATPCVSSTSYCVKMKVNSGNTNAALYSCDENQAFYTLYGTGCKSRTIPGYSGKTVLCVCKGDSCNPSSRLSLMLPAIGSLLVVLRAYF